MGALLVGTRDRKARAAENPSGQRGMILTGGLLNRCRVAVVQRADVGV